jgi:outer membrane murein-binding lipoprotein Lpp
MLATLQEKLLAAVLLLAIGVLIGAGGSHLFYAPRLELARNQVAQMGQDIKDQNTAIEKMKSDAKERAQQAQAAIDAAQAEARRHQTRAQQLLLRQKPAGQDDCQAAADLISQELGK